VGGLKAHDWLLNPGSCPGYVGYKIVARETAPPYVHHTEHLTVNIPSRYALVNITDHLQEALGRAGIRDGLCLVSAMHITAGVYVNDAEGGLLSDISEWIERLAPFGRDYRHHQTGEDNGDAHLKSYLTNHCLTAPITKGEFDFGPWQQVFYAEFDGRRAKRILLKFTGLAA
jgi:secondary thiamine-phosphate synthase enzyme